MLNVAIQAIRKAGNFIIKQYEFLSRTHATSSSDHINVIIAKIHDKSNYIIATIIKKFYPSHTINIERNNIIHNKKHNNNVHWIIESIDNNVNFIRQFPFFALSIAIQFNERIEIGVIYDPVHNELFSACRGKGAQCNGYRIRLNNNFTKNLTNAILAISCAHLQYDTTAIHLIHKLHQQYTSISFRYTGSIALDLAYTAIGRIDGCYIITLKHTNKLASGILIVQESGGLITDIFGNSINNHDIPGTIIAGHSKIIKIVSSLSK